MFEGSREEERVARSHSVPDSTATRQCPEVFVGQSEPDISAMSSSYLGSRYNLLQSAALTTMASEKPAGRFIVSMGEGKTL